MTKHSIFEMCHSCYDGGHTPLRDLHNAEYEKTLKELGLDINKFYVVQGRLHQFCYKNGTVLVEVYSMRKEALIHLRVKEIIEQREEVFNELIQEKKYSHLFALIDKPYRFEHYKKLYNDIPDKDKYDIFMDIYTGSEYGFDFYDIDFVKDILSYQQNRHNVDKLDGDVITIYRGEGDKSTYYEDAYSWTTDIKIARFFAHRFDSVGNIFRAKVKKEDIIDYLPNRGESEVLVFSDKLFDVEKIE